jgi:hypothetical protein
VAKRLLTEVRQRGETAGEEAERWRARRFRAGLDVSCSGRKTLRTREMWRFRSTAQVGSRWTMATAAVGETPAETLSLTGRNRTGKRLGKAGMRRRRRRQLGFGDGLLAS